MLVDFIDSKGALYIGPVADKLVLAVKSRIDDYRSAMDMVIYICDHHLEDDSECDMFPPHSLGDSGGDQVIDQLKPEVGERVIYKRRFSSFFGTNLDLALREKGISEIELAGWFTNICIIYAAADARMPNYDVCLSKQAVASFDQDAHRFALQEMEKSLGVKYI